MPEQGDNGFMSDKNYIFCFSRKTLNFLSLLLCFLARIDCSSLEAGSSFPWSGCGKS